MIEKFPKVPTGQDFSATHCPLERKFSQHSEQTFSLEHSLQFIIPFVLLKDLTDKKFFTAT